MRLLKGVQQHCQRTKRGLPKRRVDHPVPPRLGVRCQVLNEEFGLARSPWSEQAQRLSRAMSKRVEYLCGKLVAAKVPRVSGHSRRYPRLAIKR